MKKIGIVTDKAADLPEEIIRENLIAVVSVELFWPEIDNLPGDNTFQKMRELEKKGIQSFGKTSQPPMKAFLDKYNLQLENFEKVLCFTISSGVSGTYNSAIQAKKFLRQDQQNNVFVVDSLSASGGQALLVLKAIELIKSGEEAENIVKKLEEFVSKIHLYIMFEDPKWIEASGRVSHLVANLMRGMAKAGIRPVMTFKKGALVPAGLKTGSKDILKGLFNQFEADVQKIKTENKKIKAVITHCDELNKAEKLKETIEKEFNNAEVVFINIVNNVVGAPVGPGALALGWCEN